MGFVANLLAFQAKKREFRIREIVMPHIEKLKPPLYQTVLKEMQTERVTGTKAEIQAEHSKRSKHLVSPPAVYSQLLTCDFLS
jgi:hypothetical protein